MLTFVGMTLLRLHFNFSNVLQYTLCSSHGGRQSQCHWILGTVSA